MRVESIEGHSCLQLLNALDSYAPGTPEHARIICGYFLQRPELLAAAGLASDSQPLHITFAMADGSKRSRWLPGEPGPGTARAGEGLHVIDDIDPQLSLSLTFADFAAGRDPVMSKIASALTGSAP